MACRQRIIICKGEYIMTKIVQSYMAATNYNGIPSISLVQLLKSDEASDKITPAQYSFIIYSVTGTAASNFNDTAMQELGKQIRNWIANSFEQIINVQDFNVSFSFTDKYRENYEFANEVFGLIKDHLDTGTVPLSFK